MHALLFDIPYVGVCTRICICVFVFFVRKNESIHICVSMWECFSASVCEHTHMRILFCVPLCLCVSVGASKLLVNCLC